VAQTGQAYAYTGDDPVNGVDPNGLCWSVAPGVAGPCLAPPPGVPYDGSFTPDEIAQYPQVLEGMNPDDVLNQLGWNADDLPPGWSIDQANSSSKGAGTGWKTYTLNGGGYQIRWSPGSALPDHSNDPYWTVSSGKYGVTAGNGKNALGPAIDAGEWDQPPYAVSGPSGGGAGQCINGGRGPQTASCVLDPFPLDLLSSTMPGIGSNNPCASTKPTYEVL
jgi:hypothetical protein